MHFHFLSCSVHHGLLGTASGLIGLRGSLLVLQVVICPSSLHLRYAALVFFLVLYVTHRVKSELTPLSPFGCVGDERRQGSITIIDEDFD